MIFWFHEPLDRNRTSVHGIFLVFQAPCHSVLFWFPRDILLPLNLEKKNTCKMIQMFVKELIEYQWTRIPIIILQDNIIYRPTYDIRFTNIILRNYLHDSNSVAQFYKRTSTSWQFNNTNQCFKSINKDQKTYTSISLSEYHYHL